MAKIKIDEKKCIGCSLCSELCPKSFELRGDKAVVKKPNVDKTTCEKEAADSCPVDAIIIS
ncbi:MAG: ferredoxin [Nanoarchaeota archaeon]|nr:ferredoxin [Nanoarchaeota archaeon]MBU1051196.1 ferredoxin [Nanoarchaeota archaeon]MBU1988683.1 ferredoxin [Nanoarchaeota archaeon]